MTIRSPLYSFWHDAGSIFLLLVRLTAAEAMTLLKRFEEAASPSTSIVFLGVFDQLPWELARDFGRVKCPRTVEQAEQMALEAWRQDNIPANQSEEDGR